MGCSNKATISGGNCRRHSQGAAISRARFGSVSINPAIAARRSLAHALPSASSASLSVALVAEKYRPAHCLN
jgi:hypothetical protein